MLSPSHGLLGNYTSQGFARRDVCDDLLQQHEVTENMNDCGPRSLRHGSACARAVVIHPSPTAFNMAPRSAPTVA